MRRLEGKVTIITGGNTGIGRAVAIAYADEGADVAVAWIAREPETHSLVREIQQRGRRALAIRTDVTVETDVRAMVARVREVFGRVDILVSNAGIQQAQVEDWDRMIAVRMRGAFLCCREVAPVMIAQKGGRIIIVTSQLAYIGRARYTAYSAGKGGLLNFTRALAQELAPHGVLVNAVAPGLITPPVGINLYVVQGIRPRGRIADVIIGSMPFVATLFAMIALLCFFPGLALWIPRAAMR
jgi:3-oxoacyl-[acyl-carrier protein] reductase